MTVKTFRLPANLVRSGETGRLATALGISSAEALGLMIQVICGMADAEQPDPTKVSATVLEEWAGWRGKPGLFAKVFLAGISGRLPEWLAFLAADLRKTGYDRRRKGKTPTEPPTPIPTDIPTDTPTSFPTDTPTETGGLFNKEILGENPQGSLSEEVTDLKETEIREQRRAESSHRWATVLTPVAREGWTPTPGSEPL